MDDCIDCELELHCCVKCSAAIDHGAWFCEECLAVRIPEAEDPSDWRGYFRGYALLRQARNKTGGYEIQKDAQGRDIAVYVGEQDDEDVFTVSQEAEEVDAADMPLGVRQLVKRLTALNYEVTVMASITDHPAEVYKAASAAGAQTPHAKGDPKSEAHQRQHIAVAGFLWGPDGDPALAVWVNWSKKLVEKSPNTFQWARTYDPISGMIHRNETKDLNSWMDVVVPKPGAAVKRSKPAPRMDTHEDAIAEINLGEWKPS